MSFAKSVLDFYRSLEVPSRLPKGVEVLFPFNKKETWDLITIFLEKYYSDSGPRVLLMGINPGRFGAGTTGIGFTDPIRLQEVCHIPNDLEKKAELSSKFIYDVIDDFGGPEKFFSKFFISSVCPIGFIKEGKNYNYYDDPKLEQALLPFILNCFKKKLSFGCSHEVAFSIGQGKNVKFLEKLNEQNLFFKEVKALPHPRWVMQYRLKRKQEFIDQYLEELSVF